MGCRHIGLAAAKLAERYNRSRRIVWGIGRDVYGSARSVDGVNIFEALATQADLYEKFGGHSGAAGLTVEEKHLETIRRRISMYLDETYPDEVFQPVRYYDIELDPKNITGKLIKELDLLEPYGFKNKRVDVLIKNAGISEIKPMGTTDTRASQYRAAERV